MFANIVPVEWVFLTLMQKTGISPENGFTVDIEGWVFDCPILRPTFFLSVLLFPDNEVCIICHSDCL